MHHLRCSATSADQGSRPPAHATIYRPRALLSPRVLSGSPNVSLYPTSYTSFSSFVGDPKRFCRSTHIRTRHLYAPPCCKPFPARRPDSACASIADARHSTEVLISLVLCSEWSSWFIVRASRGFLPRSDFAATLRRRDDLMVQEIGRAHV